MNNNNNNNIVFDNDMHPNTGMINNQQTSNIQPNIANNPQVNNDLDNSTIDYNSLYNLNTSNNQINNTGSTINQIDQIIAEEQIVAPEVTALENSQTSKDSGESKKGLTLVIIFGILILGIVIFIFPYLIKKGF